MLLIFVAPQLSRFSRFDLFVLSVMPRQDVFLGDGRYILKYQTRG
jgi:hypothetical protein